MGFLGWVGCLLGGTQFVVFEFRVGLGAGTCQGCCAWGWVGWRWMSQGVLIGWVVNCAVWGAWWASFELHGLWGGLHARRESQVGFLVMQVGFWSRLWGAPPFSLRGGNQSSSEG